jgi:hypothetical protein
MSKHPSPIKNNVYPLKPHNDKARPSLIDPELEQQYEELLLLREKIRMAMNQNQQRLRS